MDIANKLALSLVSLALAKNGYRTYKGVPPGMGREADILAIGHGERFAVQVAVLERSQSIPRQLEGLRSKYQAEFGTPTFFAFLADGETVLLVDAALHQRMRFQNETIRLEALPAEVTITSG
jgi:hypothetical protein